jgi:hypothetical protein
MMLRGCRQSQLRILGSGVAGALADGKAQSLLPASKFIYTTALRTVA